MAKKVKLSLNKSDRLLEHALVKDENKPYEVPSNWVWVKCLDIFNVEYGKNLLTKQLTNEGYPVFGANGLIGYYSEYMYKKEQVLISCRGANSGVINVTLPFSFITNNSLIIEPKIRILSTAFIRYLFESIDRSKLISGSAQPQITVKAFENFYITLPPLHEQQRIVDLIESLFEKLDRAKELVQNALDSFEARKSAVYYKAFTGELTAKWREETANNQSAVSLLNEIQIEKLNINLNQKEIALDSEESLFSLPQGWIWTNLGSLINKIEAGKNFSCPEIPVTIGNIGLVKISAVTWGKFDCTETKTVTDKTKINREYFIHKGDFLISRANTIELVGMSVIVDDIDYDIMISDKVWRVKFFKGLEIYVNYYLKSVFGRKEIESRATGNQLSMRNISQDSFRKIKIPLPPFEEQIKIVKILDNLFEKEQKANELCDIIENIDHMKKSILARAFRGELSTNNPNEESALELLKEVLTERIES